MPKQRDRWLPLTLGLLLSISFSLVHGQQESYRVYISNEYGCYRVNGGWVVTLF